MTEAEGVETAVGKAEALLREELALAPYRSQLTMIRLATTVRTERVTARDHLQTVYAALENLDEDLRAETDDGVISSRGRLVLQNDVAIFLNGKRGQKRPYDLRHREAVDRLARAENILGPRDPELWRLRVREAEARALLPEHRTLAIGDIRALLEEANYPTTWSFRLSIHAMNLTVFLRNDDEDETSADLALDILNREIAKRTEKYSSLHPFTLVARANLILYTLTRLEIAADKGELSSEQVQSARRLVEDARQLHADRVQSFGERAGPATRSLAHQARALRLAGQHEESRVVAMEAYALRGDDPETRRDDEVPAILQILIASALAERQSVALTNAKLIREGADHPQLHRKTAQHMIDQEVKRAVELRKDVHRRLNHAQDVLAHQVPYARWIKRAERIRARVDRA